MSTQLTFSVWKKTYRRSRRCGFGGAWSRTKELGQRHDTLPNRKVATRYEFLGTDIEKRIKEKERKKERKRLQNILFKGADQKYLFHF